MSEFHEEDTTASAFFRRLVNRPVPGTISKTVSKSGGGFPQSSAMSSSASTDRMTNAGSTSLEESSFKTASSSTPIKSEKKPYRVAQFEMLLSAENVDLVGLRKLSWNGIPPKFRPMVWQLLLGYLPTNKSRRESALQRKRKEYQDSIPIYFDVSESDRTTQEGETRRQIFVDLPRTCPDIPFYQQEPIQRAMERVLYIWAIRHPASGYVQGMNDILTPLLFVSMYQFTSDVLRVDVASLDQQTLMDVEADAYWCLTKLLDNIQDHYTFSQPGLQRMVLRLEDLVHRLDSELHDHFESEGLLYIQFSFRWMNCLMLRELPLKAIMRLWDTYLSEEGSAGGFENFHVYVCAVFLKTYKSRLLLMQFQELLTFLQELPTSDWGEEEVEPVLSQAYILQTLFDDSHHL